jgi:hypothetical protein
VFEHALPGTSPPPSARSNSSRPVCIRASGFDGTSSGANSIRRPPDDKSCLLEKTVSGASSVSVFHSEQSAHWPCQRFDTLPHAAQT